jgi:hypothetical protein
MPKRVKREKIYTRRRRGRPKVRWLDDVQEDLRAMGIEGWRGKPRIETCGGEYHGRPRLMKGCRAKWWWKSP